jgi:hypothetical protein
MKPHKVSMSCDSNPYYLEFWEPVSKMWKRKIGVEPFLFFVGEKSQLPPNYDGTVVHVEPIEGISLHTQAQWARFHFTKIDLDSVWITSDIDMFPLSPFYFLSLTEPFSCDSFVSLNSDLRDYFPVCYNVAKGKTFCQVLELEEHFYDCVRKMSFSIQTPEHFIDGKAHDNWSCDEVYSSSRICNYRANRPGKVVQIRRPDGYHDGRRINRTNWFYDRALVEQDWYIDCHSIRPYAQNKRMIDDLLSLSLGEKSWI